MLMEFSKLIFKINYKKKYVAALFLFLSVCSKAAAQSGDELLDTLISRGVIDYHTVRVADAELEASLAEYRAALGNFQLKSFANIGKSVSSSEIPITQRIQDLNNIANEGNEQDTESIQIGLNKELYTGGSVSFSLGATSTQDNIVKVDGITRGQKLYNSSAQLNYRQPLLANRGSSETMRSAELARLDINVKQAGLRLATVSAIARAHELYWTYVFADEEYKARSELVNIFSEQLKNKELEEAGGLVNFNQVLFSRVNEAEILESHSESLLKRENAISDISLDFSVDVNFQEQFPHRQMNYARYKDFLDNSVLKNWPLYLEAMARYYLASTSLKFSEQMTGSNLDFIATYVLGGLSYREEDITEHFFDDKFKDWSVGVEYSGSIGENQYRKQILISLDHKLRAEQLNVERSYRQFSRERTKNRSNLDIFSERARHLQEKIAHLSQIEENISAAYQVGGVRKSDWSEAKAKVVEAKLLLIELYQESIPTITSIVNLYGGISLR